LLTALAFHYTAAAETLARRGARVDNVIAAAGLGHDHLVMRFIDQEGGPTIAVPWIRMTGDPLQLALVWAGIHGRTATAEILLRKGVDPAAADSRQFTALHWAAYYGHVETVRMLLDCNAPHEARNCYGGTPLGQTIWATIHEGVRPGHPAIIDLLEGKGKG
ncbi:MAG: ankyrin repeat domain-containing protein, partial [Bryobacteraceae bacterium]